jgi:hypothetical protein
MGFTKTTDFEVSTMSLFEEPIAYDSNQLPQETITINLNERVDRVNTHYYQYLIWVHNKVIIGGGRFYSYGYYFRVFDFENSMTNQFDVFHYILPDEQALIHYQVRVPPQNCHPWANLNYGVNLDTQFTFNV